MDTSLIISSTNAGKKLKKAITNINPDKDNAVLKTFAQKVNALTTNTYLDATRVNKMSVEEEYQQGGGTSKQEGVITIDGVPAPYTYNDFFSTSDGGVTVTYNGDGQLYCLGTSIPDAVLRPAAISSGDVIRAGDLTSVMVFACPTDNFTAAVAYVYFSD